MNYMRDSETSILQFHSSEDQERETTSLHVEELRTSEDVRCFFEAKAIAYGHGQDDAEQNVRRLEATEFGRNFLFGIKQNGEVVAGVELGRMERNGVQCAYEWNEFVVAALRGQNMVAALHESVIQAARAMGCEYVFALVDRDTPAAVRSFQKFGYTLNTDSNFNDLRSRFPGDDVYIYSLSE